jgi:hypothetical protein
MDGKWSRSYSLSLKTNPRINRGITQIRRKIDQEGDQRDNENGRFDDRKVSSRYGINGEFADARPAEHRLNDDGAVGQTDELETSHS